ncbi:hypothetical protein CI109_104527 [Kwoniella shandongensis]|uniref:Uncharacterized protein n=1 Tax=Kwoniella shandongensis TaxID=1734106 RepID=A0AAJ8LMZ3_9TREE
MWNKRTTGASSGLELIFPFFCSMMKIRGIVIVVEGTNQSISIIQQVFEETQSIGRLCQSNREISVVERLL